MIETPVEDERLQIARMFVPRWNKYIKMDPHPKQAAFLSLENFGVEEALYGGAASAGKSWTLLAGALQYVEEPEYRAVIFRRTYAELSLPGALLDQAHLWLDDTDAEWDDNDKQWSFPSGAKLNFGYIDNEADLRRYQSAAFHYMAFDELTHFPFRWYSFVAHSRVRRTLAIAKRIPMRVWSATNPGGISHDDVFNYFVSERKPDKSVIFIPGTIDDNPHVDREDYERRLSKLDPITQKQMRWGDWSARQDGTHFKREDFVMVDDVEPDPVVVRYWDFAATDPKKRKKGKRPGDPDYTVGFKMSMSRSGLFYTVRDIRRFRCEPAELEEKVRQVAIEDGHEVEQNIEQEPGASGKIAADSFVRRVFRGFTCIVHKEDQNKVTRAGPYASQVRAKCVRVLRREWTQAMIDEHEAFPNGGHDDMVDGGSGAIARLMSKGTPGDIGLTVGVRRPYDQRIASV